MNMKSYRIDEYKLEIYGSDRKGKRTRWGDKIIYLYSEGREVGQAVFALDDEKPPESNFSGDKIFYYATGNQFRSVWKMLRSKIPVYIAWRHVHDPKEEKDGDAFFYTEEIKRKDKNKYKD